MAEEAAAEDGEEQSGGNKKVIIIFVVVLVLAIGGSVGGTLFFLNQEPATAEVAPDATSVVVPQEAIYHNMRPAYIINYLTGAKPRYLQAEFTVMARNEEAIEAVILHMPLIRSEIVSFLTEQNFLELQTQEGKEYVRQGIVENVNAILATYDVRPGIEAVMLTNFVLQ